MLKGGQAKVRWSQCKASMEQSHSEDKGNTSEHKDVLCTMCFHLQGTYVNVRINHLKGTLEQRCCFKGVRRPAATGYVKM